MSEFKGTKGKWHFTIRLGALEMYADRITEFDIICNFERSTSNEVETKSNAKLISHAPEMLEMLKSAKDLLEAYPSEAEMHLKATEIRDLIKRATNI